MANIYPSKKYQAIIQKMDKDLKPDDPAYLIAVVLLGMVGARDTSSAAIAEETELPVSVVRAIHANAKRGGIIGGKNSINANWNDPKDGGIGFWTDVAVCQGLLRRVKSRKTKIAA